MNSIESEAYTRPALNFVEGFFAEIPRDERYSSVQFEKVMPSATFREFYSPGDQISFTLEKKTSPFCYVLNDVHISANVTIFKSDEKTLPDKTAVLGISNNILHSLFESMNIEINDVEISSTAFYHYKSYLTTLLTYGSDSKLSWLQAQGWADDQNQNFESESNAGFLVRSAFFRKNRESSQEFVPEGTTFCGRLDHDLITSEKVLPPGTRVRFSFRRSRDEFMIWTKELQSYKVSVKNLCLYVPVATLTLSCYNELMIRFPKEVMKYHYRRWTVKKIQIPKSQSFNTYNLFPESENPTRIFFVFVEDLAVNGSYFKNPFKFGRLWTYKVDYSGAQSYSDERKQFENKEKLFNAKLDEMNKTLQLLAASQLSALQKGKIPATRQNSSILAQLKETCSKLVGGEDFVDEATEEEEEESDHGQTSRADNSDTQSVVSVTPSLRDTTKTLYLTSVQLEHQSKPIDDLRSEQTESSATNDYLRLYRTNQQANQLNGCTLTYNDFLFGFHVVGYDLTTSNDGGTLAFSTPNVRVGSLSCKVEFNDVVPPNLDLQLLVFAEFNAMMQIDHNGQIITSYSSK